MKKKGIYIAIVAVLAIALVGSAIYLFSYFWSSKKSEDLNNQLREDTMTTAATTEATTAATETTEETTEETDPEETYAQGRDYKAFYEKNPNEDFVGWLRIEGTVVDYPVMQTSTDNANYYLYRDYNKNNSAQGTIYAREECDVYKPSDNVTLYGHTMKDGSMFYCLHNYTAKATWEKNNLIFFDTFDPKTEKVEYHTYKIFSVFKTSANLGEGFSYHKFENAKDQKEFDEFVSTCKKLAFYDTGVTPKYGDKLLCLSTCEYTLDNGRLVVAAVRIS